MTKKESTALPRGSKAANADAKSKTAPQASKAALIYVGASLPGMKSNTVITGKLPKVLDEPFVRELVIPTEDFALFTKKKNVSESREAFCYRKSVEYAKRLHDREG